MNNEHLNILKKFETITRILKNLTSCLKNFEIVRVKSHVAAPLRPMGSRCSSAETQICHRSYIIAVRWTIGPKHVTFP